ncbi:non-ribosomal peptide synthetase [Actinokineospora bangkokensis]|uniref:Carrier domain-containing protein n=1 Tax=Actinokineospora bangkokensis TaxID=1193682 RepID=A0A1Q9LLX0_9PSEU|nr:non-ribosomal peptide synthetase [Actinokineospora bangkokensis]OLR93037.1 hypothetical protein BJP25_18980 [Actinokineospora bangkokensis]
MEVGAPLSFGQERLWFVEQVRGGAPEHVSVRAFRLSGPVDEFVLAAAFAEVAERHEVLRTRYDALSGSPVQVVDELVGVDFTAVVAADLAAVERELLGAPFDLRTGPPWRAVLARVDQAVSVLLIAVHHIAVDGWSWGVVLRELGECYAAFALGLPSPLPDLPLQYTDYAAWQREVWESAPDTEGVAWWRARLAGVEPLELPLDRRRPPVWEPAGAVVEFAVPADVAHAVRLVARGAGVTSFMAYLAVFQVLLARYARRTDVAVGVAVAGRDLVELEGLVGLFSGTIVLRADLSGAPSFSVVLDRVREVALDAFEHQGVPFDQVVSALDRTPDPSRHPVHQVSFALDTEQVLRLPGVASAPHPVPPAGVGLDLALTLVERPDGGVAGRFAYPTALFDRETVDRMATALTRLLDGLITDPGTPVAAVDLLGERDRELLDGWNRTALPRPEQCLPELFAAQAQSTPDAVAVVAGAETLTYQELDARSARLAAYLRERGATTGGCVGVVLPRGLDLTTAVLAVLRAGAVYVPLPLDHPGRMAAMVADAGIRLAVASDDTAALLPPGVEVAPVDGRGGAALPAVVGADAAYAMYTSGSTGRPKGVVITHAGLRNRVLWAVEALGLGPGERVLQKTPAGFDASVWEFLAPLVCGAAVVMAPPEAHRDPAVLLGAVAEHGVTVLQLVPSVLRLVVAAPGLEDCTALRVVCSAGEPLPTSLCEGLLARKHVEVVNTYGPTECSIDATAWRYRPGEAGDTVPIGTPLPNTEAHVVDEGDRLVPIGTPGELCLAGVGLARGYLGRGDLTAERFTPHPHATEPGARWYRTGDLVRRRSDGVLEFLGRVDRQVKVRGVRVEPGEVEAVLLAHPLVAAAAVVARREGEHVELAAYVVPTPGAVVHPEALRDHVADRLPAAMVPAAVVALAELPLTVHGKLDHAALPSPDEPGAAALTGTEVVVTSLVAELLGAPGVDVDTDFFAAGGHSVQAVRLLLRVRRAFEVELAPGDVFRLRTARALAAAVDTARTAALADAIRPVPRAGGVVLSAQQERVLADPAAAGPPVVVALRLRGEFSAACYRRAVDDAVRRHEVLRTRYPGGVARVDPPGPASFALVDLTGTPDAEALGARLVSAAAARRCAPAAEHPLRTTVARLAADDHLVLLVVHPVAADAWSADLLLREVDQTYRAFAAGEPAPLRPRPVQYSDFAAWQRGSASVAAQVGHWESALDGAGPVDLPADRPRPARRDTAAGRVSATVPADVARALLDLGAEHGCPPFATVLAVFQVVLAAWSGRSAVTVGVPVAGRTRPGTEDLVGHFTNHLPLRLDLSGDPTCADLLDRAREVALVGLAHQDVPAERVAGALGGPLFRAVFELERAPGAPRVFCGAQASPVPVGGPTTTTTDLRMTARVLPDGSLRCSLDHATALFDRSTAQGVLDRFTAAAARVAAAPGAAVSTVDSAR